MKIICFCFVYNHFLQYAFLCEASPYFTASVPGASWLATPGRSTPCRKIQLAIVRHLLVVRLQKI